MRSAVESERRIFGRLVEERLGAGFFYVGDGGVGACTGEGALNTGA